MMSDTYNGPWKIISGGQTGADEGGLLAAKEMGLKTGGTAPKGFKRESSNGREVLPAFGLTEDSSSDYKPRTEKNIIACDGTILFDQPSLRGEKMSPGSRLTLSLAYRYNKPILVNPTTPREISRWLFEHSIGVLNVAGNRESVSPGITAGVKKLLMATLFIFKGVANGRERGTDKARESDWGSDSEGIGGDNY